MTTYWVEFRSIQGHHSFDYKSDSMCGRALMIISMSTYYDVVREWEEKG